ncbi:hypothetical protein, partial [Stenotrophomonas maltophilia group sp. RNC7]|uniref:hypothetical protein n=1 Tax=Stenotrophomonas maltophilia group sp. RNC7 TaxID=3071467 RepID=UPI0027E162F2
MTSRISPKFSFVYVNMYKQHKELPRLQYFAGVCLQSVRRSQRIVSLADLVIIRQPGSIRCHQWMPCRELLNLGDNARFIV